MTRLRGKRKSVKDSEDDDESGSESESEESHADGVSNRQWDGLETFEGNREECKLVLVVRTDLGMGKGADPFFPMIYHTAFNSFHTPCPPWIYNLIQPHTKKKDFP